MISTRADLIISTSASAPYILLIFSSQLIFYFVLIKRIYSVMKPPEPQKKSAIDGTF
jgi:hypothetical protein